jgi:hypothetical protein
MWNLRLTTLGLFRASQLQYQPGLKTHDPNPPITLDSDPQGVARPSLGDATSSATGSAPPTGTSATTLGAATSSAVGNTPMGTLAINAHADRLTTTAVPTTPTSFSIGFWVKRKSGHPDPGMFVTVDGSGFTFSIGTDVDVLTLWNVGGGYTKPLQIAGTMTQDKWYYVAFKATSATTGVLYRFDEAGNMATASGSLGFTLSTLVKTTICGDDVGSFFPVVDMGRVRAWTLCLHPSSHVEPRRGLEP